MRCQDSLLGDSVAVSVHWTQNLSSYRYKMTWVDISCISSIGNTWWSSHHCNPCSIKYITALTSQPPVTFGLEGCHLGLGQAGIPSFLWKSGQGVYFNGRFPLFFLLTGDAMTGIFREVGSRFLMYRLWAPPEDRQDEGEWADCNKTYFLILISLGLWIPYSTQCCASSDTLTSLNVGHHSIQVPVNEKCQLVKPFQLWKLEH